MEAETIVVLAEVNVISIPVENNNNIVITAQTNTFVIDGRV